MSQNLLLQPIGVIHTPYKEKFGIPRQSGLVQSQHSYITFCKEYQDPDCFRGIEEYSHLWLMWGFSANNPSHWSPTVRPPRLGGNERRGVFATRSPFRPNPVGLSCVRLEKITINPQDSDKVILYVSGADLMDQTPIYDIKPYLPYTDCHSDASYVFAKQALSHRLEVCDPEHLLSKLPMQEEAGIRETLSLDPRPSYQADPARIYGMRYSQVNIRFQVKDNHLTILSIE